LFPFLADVTHLTLLFLKIAVDKNVIYMSELCVMFYDGNV